jgi:hypothetical protein
MLEGPARTLGAALPLLALIHRSAWKVNSPKFACWVFSEVRMHDPA